MTLQELGRQYLQQEAVLREKIRTIRATEGVNMKDGEDTLLQRRLYYLAAEAGECRRIGLYLLNYTNIPELGAAPLPTIA